LIRFDLVKLLFKLLLHGDIFFQEPVQPFFRKLPIGLGTGKVYGLNEVIDDLLVLIFALLVDLYRIKFLLRFLLVQNFHNIVAALEIEVLVAEDVVQTVDLGLTPFHSIFPIPEVGGLLALFLGLALTFLHFLQVLAVLLL